VESLARLASANSGATQLGSLSPVQAIQVLAEEGYLEKDVAQRLREMVHLRNAVVHGDLSVQVPPGQVEYLLEQLEAIASDIITRDA
jgi:uncharacterized protein YutE (UPF0331/DUF86 family)